MHEYDNKHMQEGVTLISENETTEGYTESFTIFTEWSANSELYMVLLPTALARPRFRSTAPSEESSFEPMGPVRECSVQP